MTAPEEQNVTNPQDAGPDDTGLEASIGESVENVEVVDDSYEVTEEPLSAPVPQLGSDRPMQTVGRRKQAVARVHMVPGSGGMTLNGRSIEQYFPNKLHQQLVKSPLVLVEREETFDIQARLHGGGPSGQAGALRLAIARALQQAQPEDRGPLKKAGYLTRDDRAVERKKYGLKKARKASQYSKR